MAKSLRVRLEDIEERIKRGDPSDRDLSRLRGMHLKDPEDYEARGRCFSQMNLYDEAAADYEAAISGNGGSPQAYYHLAGALSALGRREDAVEALREAFRLRPNSSNAACALSWELEMLGRYDEALAILIQHVRLEPSYRRSVDRHLGRIYGRQGRLRESFASYLRCAQFNPPSAVKPNPFMEKRLEELRSLRSRAEKRGHEDPRSFMLLGMDLHDAGWNDVAVDVLATAARLQPSVLLYRFIGEIHEGYLKLTEAIDAYLECLEKLSGTLPAAEMSTIYDALVMDLFKCGRTQEVLRYGAEAVSIGAAGPTLLKYYTFARDNPDQLPEGDPVSGGWTAPYYAHTELDVPIPQNITSRD